MKTEFRAIAKPLIHSTNQFETILIRLLFPFEKKEEEIGKYSLLPKLLVYMCEKYPTEELFQKEILRNYILNLSVEVTFFGTSGFFVFNLVVPDPTLLKENRLEEAVAFFHEVIYHPKVEQKGFDEFELEREKKNLTTSIQNKQKNLRGYLSKRIPEIIDDTGLLSQNIETHLEQLKQINKQNLYQFYQEKIQSKVPLSFIIGNVDQKETEQLFTKYFYKKPTEIVFSKNYRHYLKPRKKVQEITEEKAFQQSALVIAYKIKNMKEKDRIPLSLIKSLLVSSSSNLLLKKLRGEHSLVYSANALTRSSYGEIELHAYIDAAKKEMTLEKMFEVIEELKKEEIIKPLLEKIKERRRLNLERDKDSKARLLNDIMDQYLGTDLTASEEYEKIKRITEQEIIELVNRFVLDTIYFVKEVPDEK